jgi:hypothetical protein
MRSGSSRSTRCATSTSSARTSLGTEARAGEFGILAATVHRSLDNPNEVMVTLDLRSTADALALLSADDRFRAWMDRVGVEAYPSVFVGREAGAR